MIQAKIHQIFGVVDKVLINISPPSIFPKMLYSDKYCQNRQVKNGLALSKIKQSDKNTNILTTVIYFQIYLKKVVSLHL